MSWPGSSIHGIFQARVLKWVAIDFSAMDMGLSKFPEIVKVREAWHAAVHGVAKSWTPLSGFAFTFHFHALEKEMATHSSVLAWRIPGMGEPGGLPSMGSHRVEHDWGDLAAACPLSQWCHPTISSPVTHFCSCPPSFPALGSFAVSWLFALSGQSIGASASASVLSMNIQGWFPLGLTGLISLLSRRLSRVFSNTTVQKHHFFGAQPSLWFNSHIHTWLLEKPLLWPYGPLSAKWCLCSFFLY